MKASKKRARFTFCIEAVISMHIDVEAESLKAAIKEAQSRGPQGLCHQCSDGDPGEWNTSGELDCDPPSSKLVAVYDNNEEVDLALAVKAGWEQP